DTNNVPNAKINLVSGNNIGTIKADGNDEINVGKDGANPLVPGNITAKNIEKSGPGKLKMNFNLPNNYNGGNPAIKLTDNGLTDLTGTDVNVNNAKDGTTYTLVKKTNGGTINFNDRSVQKDQTYTITDKDHYQYDGETFRRENGNQELVYKKGTITNAWGDTDFDSSELTKNQASNKAAGATELFGNKGNTVIVKENAGDLGGKNISSGRADVKDTETPNTIHDNYTTIKGGTGFGDVYAGYGDSGTQDVHDNHISFEETSKGAVVNGNIGAGYNANGNVHDNTVTTDDTTINGNVYGAQTANGNAVKNIVNLQGGSVTGDVYGSKASGSATNSIVNLSGTQVAGNVYAAEAASGSNNVVNFRSGRVAGTLYGVSSANASNSGNSLNILSSNSGNGLNAGNFANFNKLEFNLASLGEIENDASSSTKRALNLTGPGNTDLSGTDIFVNSTSEFNALNNASYPDGDNKKYTLAYKSGGGKFTGYDPRFKDKGYVTQLNKNYIIKDANTFSRNIGGMHISEDERELYIQKLIKTNESINGDFDADELQKYLGAGGLNGNNIDIGKAGEDKNFNARNIHAAGANNTLNFISGHNVGVISASGSGNTLNIGASNSSPAAVNSLSAKNISGFDRLNFFLPNSIRAGDSVLTLSDPTANTDLSNVSNITAYISGVSGPLSPSSEIHLINKQGSGSLIAPNAANMHATLNVGVSLSYNPKIYQSGNYLNLGFDASSAPSARVNSNTKSFAETRVASLASLKNGSELITNYLDKLIPDGHLELFPFAISEAYSLRHETGSHVNS
ncbi:hypothetical protein, partial [uncultured Campylobacter sp.]|uniref:hypothetical protein n=1 Tax=uncultured Campylobacter sp. TaxID=218934 RepID=UPI00261AA788